MEKERQSANEALRHQRVLRGWSQQKLAELIGASNEMISYWEGGKKKTSPFYQEKLCELFGKTAEELGFLSSGRDLSIASSSLANVIQLPQIQQTTEQEMVSALQPLAVSMQISSDVASLDIATWFATRVNDLKAFGAFWHEPTITYQQQQARINAEINKWNEMTDQDSQNTHEYLLTRRTALATLATLSTSLLTKVQFGQLTTLVGEEFLAQCATSITACYHLLKGDGLVTVEYTLPKYLPLLVTLAKSPSPFQQKAATLASQGSYLLSLVALHRLRFSERVEYCKQAVELAKIAGDRILFITALTYLGLAWFDFGEANKMLHAFQLAESFIRETPSEIPHLLQSRIYMGLAGAYARLSLRQEAEYNLHLADEVFSIPLESDFLAVFLDYDHSLKILWEGFVHVDLGKIEEQNTLSSRGFLQYEQAKTALAQIEQFPQSALISERVRVEIVNQRALVAIKSKDMDSFQKYLITGVQGAKKLGSEKRRQEAITNWKAAREQWPHEKKIMELADVLF
jgi:transcriptional regulator with XRE-family HTH domain/tetratricopeptide (TPR) repeat protein